MQESEGEHVPKEQEPQRVERMRRVIDRRRDATSREQCSQTKENKN